MKIVVIIPAQDFNQYHYSGDLAPFGDTTLLQWKIAQCKEFIDNTNIYISSSSQTIKKIALKENVNFHETKKNMPYMEKVLNTVKDINSEFILWANSMSPFIGSNIYEKMWSKLLESGKSSIISVEKRKEYVFYKKSKLNFSNDFVSRKDIEPIYIITNGIFIINKNEIIKTNSMVGSEPLLYETDYFESIEIKDVHDHNIASDLISIYFKRNLCV